MQAGLSYTFRVKAILREETRGLVIRFEICGKIGLRRADWIPFDGGWPSVGRIRHGSVGRPGPHPFDSYPGIFV